MASLGLGVVELWDLCTPHAGVLGCMVLVEIEFGPILVRLRIGNLPKSTCGKIFMSMPGADRPHLQQFECEEYMQLERPPFPSRQTCQIPSTLELNVRFA